MFGRDHEIRESTLRQYHPVGSEDLRGQFQGNSDGSQAAKTKDDAEARNDFWSIQGDFIYRHHVGPRIHLHVPKEESFSIPLKYIEVTRSTHTNLDVMQEKRINDYWEVDGDRTLSDSWKGFTKFTLLNQKLPPHGCMWRGERLTKIQATTRPDYSLPEIWSRMSKAAQKKKRKRNGLWNTKA